ncbi:hypothetical protein BU23DRAFT_323198 [Bimuria novae-zelandiae CBS 107.79]|uniref:polynucleotide adenylyltransferase n=1 Tax=Bimuria novae-zelandiae CBS 107.79 TaxID=1447943 RepID=A0A6A5VQR1_9PLEO|nr:hypothetical protein BU23DRAFT_323198 [Bimuria novae-zelandiae CBS 107.79]
MEDFDQARTQATIATKSYDTALCIIPSQNHCETIDKLRSLYDKAYERWPPHINLVYPFVALEHLSQAKERIESHLHATFSDPSPATVVLSGAGVFKHKKDITVFLQQNGGSKEQDTLGLLRSAALQALGSKASPSTFHLTVGQAQDSSVAALQFLVDKVNLLPAMEFYVRSLAILIREKAGSKADTVNQIRLWGTIDLPTFSNQSLNPLNEFWISESSSHDPRSKGDPNRPNKRGVTYGFDPKAQKWCSPITRPEISEPKSLRVSTYNVLLDSEYPPSHDRNPLLVETILAESALADVLVLQEVSDDFLSYMLQLKAVQEAYPYASHGPPSQSNIGPLPSLRNIVVLSKWYFDWELIPFHRRHKGAIVASFPSLFNYSDSNSGPLVVAGVHLTAGLTDGSVVAKKMQLQNVVSHLKSHYSNSTWLIAGDFNIPTSSYTIDEALKQKDISLETARVLDSTESTLSESGLLDAWAVARVQGVDEAAELDTSDQFELEEGATFDPRQNPLAAYISGTSGNQPQRYDRIFVRSQGNLALTKFNRFGLPRRVDDDVLVASDHYGVRAMFTIQWDEERGNAGHSDAIQTRCVLHKHAPPELSLTMDLADTLSKRAVFPTTEDRDRYGAAFELIKQILLGDADDEFHISQVPLVVVPVGSYALNVWTPESDIDCLCIGSISSKTFFQLARQRIHQVKAEEVRLLRKVEAKTGTMFELSVNGVPMDLQYCPAADVAQRWFDFPDLPPADPIFNLPVASLRKLKPIRDLTYLQRTIPSLASFRLAYHFVKQWAIDRGIHSAKFGYFGGIHLTLMLSWVCKRLGHEYGSVSASNLVLSFFHHYANFDWENDMVYDAFFHKKKPRYQRSAREPMVILGFHAPNSNVAYTATAPALQVLMSELSQADERLSTPGMTWEKFLDANTPARESFLTSFESYIKIDIQYWGRTLSRGKGLVGWVESRCISLVVDVQKALPRLSLRIWPARFAAGEANESKTYYNGCYLIGMSRNHYGSSASKEELVEARAALQTSFDRFLTQVRADDKYYDESSAWIGISLARPGDIKEMQLDDREWGDYTLDEDTDSDDENTLAELDDDLETPTTRKLPLQTIPSETRTPVSSNKLRPASDILNRLRWDSNLDPSEYIVGYEDRFLGAKETPLEKWKTEQTDEEFIPQHRILYFKKKGKDGGEVVWERATRIDKIFGSGLGNGA